MMNFKPDNINHYISEAEPAAQPILEEIRTLVKQIVPESEEAIRYGIPTFVYLKKNLLHFAAYKNHIGFYPAPSGIKAFEVELSQYKMGKGSIQFPIDAPMPYDLIKKIVEFRVKETQNNVSTKPRKKLS